MATNANENTKAALEQARQTVAEHVPPGAERRAEAEAEEYAARLGPSLRDLGYLAHTVTAEANSAFLAGVRWARENPAWMPVTERQPEEETP